MRRRVAEAAPAANRETCARDPIDATTFRIRDIESALHAARSCLDDLVLLALDAAKRRRDFDFHASGIRKHAIEVQGHVRTAEMEIEALHKKLLSRDEGRG